MDTSACLLICRPTPQEETIAQLRQATHAHQTQNAYLASEVPTIDARCMPSLLLLLLLLLPLLAHTGPPLVGRRFQIKKLQREHTIELASRDEQLDGLRAQLELARSSSASDSSIEAEFAALQRLYAHPFHLPQRHC
jgi:hypothetical protein